MSPTSHYKCRCSTADVNARYPAPFYEPLSTLGWLAGITEKIEIGTTVIILPYRSPLEIAKTCANIDQLSGGRFILGVGVGWAQGEFKVLNSPFNQRGAITDEYLNAIKLLWTQDVASFDGKSFRSRMCTRRRVLCKTHIRQYGSEGRLMQLCEGP